MISFFKKKPKLITTAVSQQQQEHRREIKGDAVTVNALGNLEKPIRRLPVEKTAEQRHKLALLLPTIGSKTVKFQTTQLEDQIQFQGKSTGRSPPNRAVQPPKSS